MGIIVNERYGWRASSDAEYWYVGAEKPVQMFVSFCRAYPTATPEEMGRELSKSIGNFAVILSLGHRIVAAVDKIRSYPVFYFSDGKSADVSNSAGVLKTKNQLSDFDPLSLLEFHMAGYVTGRETLYRNLFQLQAGECLLWEGEKRTLDTRRYYLFYSRKNRSESQDTLIDQMDVVTDAVFRRIMEEAKGAPIWVPLSAGLDSRFVLCKFKQLGYDDLHTFSYGPPHNYEAKWAEYVAGKVGVPWLFVPYKAKDIRRFFSSETRREYWRFSGEFATLPFMVDEYALLSLKRQRSIPENAILINGQTGDFISGGHIYGYHSDITPYDSRTYSVEALLQAIIKKHLSLNSSLLSRENLQKVSSKIIRLLSLENAGAMKAEEVAKYYEWWEWQERQSKYVVNGQRSYDYFGHKWYLPLWADEYLAFWPQIPFELRFKQRLYKAYLDRMDFCGVFRNFRPTVWRWQGPFMAVMPFGRMLKVLFGPGPANRFYHYMSYFSKYNNHYAPFGFVRWLRNAGELKAPFAFYVEEWLREMTAHLDKENAI